MSDPTPFDHIPTQRPSTPLLDSLSSPQDLRKLPVHRLGQLARELRAYLLYSVGQSGGHFGAGLGVVELTIALHYVYQTPEDRLVWDVGHQSYPHKILTGRREQLQSIRHGGGLSGFPKRTESEFDTFGVGHSSTSLSAAQGMALGSALAGKPRKCAAVIGDGAMTAGMAYEALNHIAHTDTDMLVILNDNNMSISPNVGGLASYLSKVWGSHFYNALREGSKQFLTKIPTAWEFARRTEEHIKGFVSPGTLFEEMGFNYIGPIDGHNLEELISAISKLRQFPGPKLLHIITRKGKGFTPAEKDPVGYHALTKLEPVTQKAPAPQSKSKGVKYQKVFGDWLCAMAERDPRVIGITPAMSEGSGMMDFARRFPQRYYDVAIAEQHAVTLAAGMACEGQKPVVAIYSTFLQRAYDQLIHDVALQNLDVTFAIDRAGLVGEDGPTHGGCFDLSYLRCIPNMLVAAPSDENECRQLLYTAWQHPGPAAVRYPRGAGPGANIQEQMQALPLGKAVQRREGQQKIALLNFGASLQAALEAADSLDASVWDMRFVKPLDTSLIDALAESQTLLVTIEENVVAGGAGSAVAEHLNARGRTRALLHLGFEDRFVEQDTQGKQLASQGLTGEAIAAAVRHRCET